MAPKIRVKDSSGLDRAVAGSEWCISANKHGDNRGGCRRGGNNVL